MEKTLCDHFKINPFNIRCFEDDTTIAEDDKSLYNILLEYAIGGTLFDFISTSTNFGLHESQARHDQTLPKNRLHAL
ncbi:hypothetical protein L484_023420 [Morus notabilis]|uniref:Protein kinase domain-containing protein n=1 Tax=Morus notabilis TaxID=981085 RepID=W9RDJ0_9ROSA|nr:hypothetical protein L484_023420 [Morus notabilis]